jgi:hypothetical protein
VILVAARLGRSCIIHTLLKNPSWSSKFLIVLSCLKEGTQCWMTRSFNSVDHDFYGVGFVPKMSLGLRYNHAQPWISTS